MELQEAPGVIGQSSVPSGAHSLFAPPFFAANGDYYDLLWLCCEHSAAESRLGQDCLKTLESLDWIKSDSSRNLQFELKNKISIRLSGETFPSY